MGDRIELRGQDRRRLREAISDAEDALLEIGAVAAGDRKATPEAIARGLRAILAGQVTLMEALLGAAASPSHASVARDDVEAGAGGGGEGVGPAQYRRRPPSDKAARAAAFAARIGKGFHEEDDADAPPAAKLKPLTLDTGDDDEDMRALAAVAPLMPKAPLPSEPASGGAPAPARAGGPSDEALRVFPLEELNRWLASGTVFQIRGSIAFLNMASMGGKVEEMSGHIRRMGFADEIGRLEAEGLAGDVLLFRRPE